ncbi:MAG: superoxide dismutase [Woeseiaceae bacterium]
MTVLQSNLPYDHDALEPYISAETLSYHYDKHHSGYVDKLNKMIAETPFAGLPLEDVISKARREAEVGILQNAQQAWNHAFLWESMSPSGEVAPEGRIKEMIEKDFGNLDGFKKQFKDASLSQFGSGWAWLVQDGDKLRILATGNADSPVATRVQPLLTLDVWEHAYYLDYQNERARYVDTFLDKLVNWKFAAANLLPEAAQRAA